MVEIEVDGATWNVLHARAHYAEDGIGHIVRIDLMRECELHGHGCIKLPGNTHIYSPEVSGCAFTPIGIGAA